MDVIRSIGYVQLYFGIFLIVSAIFVGVLTGNVYANTNSQRATSDDFDIAEAYNATEGTPEHAMLSMQWLSFNVNSVLFQFTLSLIMLVLTVFLFVMGVNFTLSGISNTRMGTRDEVHSKKKLLVNVAYAIVFSFLFALLIGMFLL